MKLLGSLASPFVRKVRIVMAEKKIDFQFVIEDPWSATSTLQTFNPLGKVPCLIMEDGGAVFDSRVIVEYLDTLTPVGKLIPSSGRERAEVKCWEALADGLLDAAILLRIERTQRTSEQQSEAWAKRQMGKVTASLEAMSLALSDHPWCTGTHYTLADISLGCALGWLAFRFPDITWRQDFANLAKLADKLGERPSFRDTAPRPAAT